jgi:parvulin-like peptidyl-prolyl isomerase
VNLMSGSRIVGVLAGGAAVVLLTAACGNKSAAPGGEAAAAASPSPAGPGFPSKIGNIDVRTSPPTGKPANAAAAAAGQAPGISITEILEKNPAPDASIASVNGVAIHTAQVDAAYQMQRRVLTARGQHLSPEDEKNLRATSFRMVIADELLNQAAIKAGIKVPPAAIDKALASAQASRSPQEWQQFLKDSHLTPALVRTQIERNLRTDAYRKSLTADKPVTEQQAKEFYDRNRETFKVPESIHALVILLPLTQKADAAERAEAKRLADEARGKAAAGEDFGALARQYSRDPSAQRGGDIGFVPRGLLFPASEQVAFGLKNGEVSPVLETPKGYTVFKVLERKPESVPTFDDVKTDLMRDMGRVMGQNILEQKVKELSDAAEIVVIDPRSQTTTAGK